MKTIIATAGEEPAGIIESLKIYPCGKLILITDERGKKAAVPKILNATEILDIKTEIVTVNPYDIPSIIDTIKKKINEQDTPTILNVTGGRKTMALAATLAGMVAGEKVEDIIYVTEEEHKTVSLPRLLNPESLLTSEKRKILRIINDKTETSAEELQAEMNVKMQAIWKHLRELEQLGYITSCKSKPRKFKLTLSGQLLA
ncbi:CRISPR locus-related DNA-binding protein [Candidatus Bathyarchaeota archaeon]|nr:CRISPR locus-related DNA-binding protein [Candidatus Bathyarchaeota archaeon]